MSVHADEKITNWNDLLKASNLLVKAPAGYETVELSHNDVFLYEYAIKHPSKKLAVRYAVRPISMVEIDYEDPHSSAPEPNHIFSMLFNTLIRKLTKSGKSPSQVYSADDARKMFNADWASIAVMDVVSEFGGEYQQILLLGIHKKNAADAYTMVLFEDYEAVKSDIELILTSMVFE